MKPTALASHGSATPRGRFSVLLPCCWLLIACVSLGASPAAAQEEAAPSLDFDPQSVFRTMELRVEIDKLAEAGQNAEAVQKGEELLLLLAELNGADHEDTLGWRSALADLYVGTGAPEKALPHFQAVLETCREQPDNGPLACLEPLSNVARCYLEMADYPKAAEIQEQCVGDLGMAAAPPHDVVVLHTARLGVIYWQMGEREKALPNYEHCLQLSLEHNGQEHPQTVITKNNLGTLLMEMGRLDDALPMLESSIAAAETVVGPDNPTRIPMLNNLGELYEKREEPDLALVTYQRSLALAITLYGAKSIEAAAGMNRVGRVENTLDHSDKAAQIFNSSLEFLQDQLNDNPRERAKVLRHLGQCYHGLGLPEDAERSFKEGIALYEERQGKAHPHTREAREELAIFFDYVGRFEEAQELREENEPGRAAGSKPKGTES